MIECSGLGYRYPSAEHVSVGPVDLCLQPGELVVLTGPTGCGKSTLLRLMAGILQQHGQGTHTGTVRFNGEDPAMWTPPQRAQRLGFVTQCPRDQIVSGSVWAELMFGLESAGIPENEMDPYVLDWFRRSGLQKERSPQSLSGGQQQQLVIASAVSAGARFLLLDEPLAQLDPPAAERTVEMLVSLARLGCTVLVVEHRLAPFWSKLDRLLLLVEGQLRNEFPAKDLCAIEIARHGVGVPSQVLFDAIAGPPPHEVRKPEAAPVAEQPETNMDGRPSLVIPATRYVYETGTTPALDTPELSVSSGTSVALLGANGSGKSTLLQCISAAFPAGMVPDAGRIMAVPQDPDLSLFCVSVKNELAFSPEEARLPKAETLLRTNLAAEDFSLVSFMERSPHSLSRGQRGRVAIAAITTGQPFAMLLDEPTAGQNHAHMVALMKGVKQQMKDGILMFATHDVELALACADRILFLRDGQIVFDGTPDRYCAECGEFSTPWVNRCASLGVSVVSPEELLGWIQ